MKRPCTCDKPECRLCWLYHNDARYRKLWEATPSFAQKVINFGKSVIDHLTSGAQKVSNEVYDQRLSICSNCEQCDKSNEVWTCKLCGCNLQEGAILPGKARWTEQQCPLDKWPKVELPLAESSAWVKPRGCCGK